MEFIKSLFRRMRQADHEGAQAIDVPDAEKGRQVIQDATTQINNFERQVANLMASKKQKQAQLPALEANIKKFEGIATKAGAAGNADDVREAVKQKLNFQGQLDSLKAEIEKDGVLEARLRKQLSDVRDQIARSSAKADSLKVRQESAKIRQSLASTTMDGTGALSQLNEWESKVMKDEALAEAKEELAGAGSTTQNLTEKYQDTSAIDEEMAKYMTPTKA
mgnify:FL=1